MKKEPTMQKSCAVETGKLHLSCPHKDRTGINVHVVVKDGYCYRSEQDLWANAYPFTIPRISDTDNVTGSQGVRKSTYNGLTKSGAENTSPAADLVLPEQWLKALTWRCFGPANMGGRIVDLAVSESDPSTFWSATASGGLLKTTNNGITWEHQFDKQATVSIGAVAVAPSDANIVWVGTGENNPRNSVSYGDCVYKSTDGGKTWQNMGLGETYPAENAGLLQERRCPITGRSVSEIQAMGAKPSERKSFFRGQRREMPKVRR